MSKIAQDVIAMHQDQTRNQDGSGLNQTKKIHQSNKSIRALLENALSYY